MDQIKLNVISGGKETEYFLLPRFAFQLTKRIPVRQAGCVFCDRTIWRALENTDHVKPPPIENRCGKRECYTGPA